jgi:hypothetical protein
MPPSQTVPESPRQAIQTMRDELDKLESAAWVRDYQGGGTMSVAVPLQAAQSIHVIGLGFTSLAAFAVETAAGQRQS